MNLPSLLLQRTSLEQIKKKKHEGDHDSAPSHSEKPLVQTEEEATDGQSDSCCMPLNELIKEDLKEALFEILEKYKCDTCMKKELPHILKGRKQLMVITSNFKSNVLSWRGRGICVPLSVGYREHLNKRTSALHMPYTSPVPGHFPPILSLCEKFRLQQI